MPNLYKHNTSTDAARISPHLTAVLQAVFVTFLWSTSWVLIKIGLKDIPSLTFAGLRYALAFTALLPFALRAESRQQARRLQPGDWARLGMLGVLFYALTQGAQFVGLHYLPAASVSLLLNFTSPLVALLGILLLSEKPTWLQWAGVLLFLAGTLVYFYPVRFPAQQAFGVFVVAGGVLANALSAILGRSINRSGRISPLLITTISMGIGSVVLLASGVILQGLPRLETSAWLIVAWLALVNTAFAFTLWNQTLRTLSAMESSLINNTMLVQIALLAWVFLGEPLNNRQILGLVLAVAGVMVVQVWPRARK